MCIKIVYNYVMFWELFYDIFCNGYHVNILFGLEDKCYIYV